MDNSETKSKLLDATKELLLSEQHPEKITARKIATAANVNLAMINYCFSSKDELLKIAVDEIIDAEFKKISAQDLSSYSPKEALKELLYRISQVTLQYERLTRLSIPYALLTAPIEIPDSLLPYIREIVKDKKDDRFCKMVAYQIVSILQIVFYRESDFYAYSGINIHEPEDLHFFIDEQINLLLGDD